MNKTTFCRQPPSKRQFLEGECLSVFTLQGLGRVMLMEQNAKISIHILSLRHAAIIRQKIPGMKKMPELHDVTQKPLRKEERQQTSKTIANEQLLVCVFGLLVSLLQVQVSLFLGVGLGWVGLALFLCFFCLLCSSSFGFSLLCFISVQSLDRLNVRAQHCLKVSKTTTLQSPIHTKIFSGTLYSFKKSNQTKPTDPFVEH